jgi:hypothetical protein
LQRRFQLAQARVRAHEGALQLQGFLREMALFRSLKLAQAGIFRSSLHSGIVPLRLTEGQVAPSAMPMSL